VIQQAYVCGVSTRPVDQLMESLGLRISRSEVSRICAQLDEQVEAFRQRPLEGDYPYLWLDAKEIGRRTDVVGIFRDDRSLILHRDTTTTDREEVPELTGA
jgi:transposase-like protein